MAKPDFQKISPTQLKRLLELHFDVVDERCSPEEIVILCPEEGCGDSSGNRSFNLKSNFTNCWRCGKTSDVPKVALYWLRRHGVEVDSEDLHSMPLLSAADQLEQEMAAPAPVDHTVALPAGFTRLIDDPHGAYAQLIGSMASRKHLELADLAEAGVGFTRSGHWEPFAIFPVYEFDRVVYYQGRTYGSGYEGQKTKKFPSRHEVPFGASHWVYGFNEALRPETQVLVIVESILNVLSLRKELAVRGLVGYEPVAVFKHAISRPQLTKLLVSSAPEFCILFDGDAIAGAWKEAQGLSGSRKTSVVRMPVGVDANDDAQLAVDGILTRQVYSPTNELADSILGL